MSNFNNNNKRACKSSSNSWKISSNPSIKIDEIAWNSSSNQWKNSLNPSKNIDEHGKQSSLEEDSVKIIGTRPPISFYVSPIVQNTVIPNTIFFIEKRSDHNRQTCRQHNYLYYQPQSAVQNHRQQYSHDRIIQQDSYKNHYYRDKGVAHVMIHSGITTPEK